MNRIKYFLLLTLTLMYIDSYGQYFKKLGMKDGLSNPSVLAIYQDSLGRMWFGTNEGVNVYDGKYISKHKSYDIIDNQRSERKLINGIVSQIVGDSLGDVFMLNNGALIKYDIRKESFKELHPQGVGALIAIKGNVWCAIRDSLFRHDAKTDSLSFYRKLNTSSIWCLEAMDDKIWIGTAGGLYVMTGDSVHCVLPEIEIFKLFISSRKEVWIASRMNGLYKIGRDGRLKKEEYSSTRVVSQQIRDFVEDSQQNIWFGTFEGLQVYNPYADTYRVYRPNYHPGSLEHQSVFSLYKDKQGTIWVGTYYGGVNYFNQSRDVFLYYPHDNSNNYCLNFPIVGEMVEDKEHDLWICTDGGGINRLNKETGTFTYYTSSGEHSILHNNVKSITFDRKRDQLYIGTYTGGISRYDKKSKRFYNYLTLYKQTGKGPNQIIYHTLFKDGWLYVSARNGLWRLNPDQNEFQLLSREQLFLTFDIDSHGYIWLTGDRNLYRMKIGDWNQLELIALESSTGSKSKITKIIEAADGTVYVATLGNGVYSYSYETGQWKRYTKKQNKLLSDFCYNIVETPMNNILITTDEGISIYSPFRDSMHSIELGIKGGISAVTEGTGVYVAENELIYVGGVDGMISFRENNLYIENTTAPDFYFSNLYINNVKVAPGDDCGVLSQSLPFTESIYLSYKQNNLMIDFSSSNYVELEKKNRYQYQLEGFDKEWISADQMRVNYTNLAPGDYVLKVRESKNQQASKEYKEITLNITIHHPWFASIWAFLFYFIVVASIVYGLLKIRMSRRSLALSLAKEKDEKERIEEVNKMKLRFFTNISHEFRTPLTLIVGQIEILLQMEKFSPAINRRLQGVHRNAMNLRYLITELLDFRKQEQGFMKLKVECVDAVSFIKDIYQLFTEEARKRNIAYTFKHAEEKIDVWVDPIQMQKVVLNLLSNAFKYTPENKSIEVSVSKQQRTIEIAVTDTGRGISQELLSKIFERFYQVDESQQKGVVGSGIGLALTKEIVEAHKGEIRADSTPGGGSSFKIHLCMGNGHFKPEELDHEKIARPLLDWDEKPMEEEQLPKNYVTEEDEIEAEENRTNMPTLLVVEDDEEVLEMLVSIFAPYYIVHKATNGQMGFDLTYQLHPDIVVSDVMMPVMSGKEMCYKIKNCLELAYIPVVLLTAQASDNYTIEGYMFGADDYITKPFNVKLLLARCGNLLKNKRMLLQKLNRIERVVSQEVSLLAIADQKLLDVATEIIKRNFDNPDFDMNMLAADLNMGRSKMFTRMKEVVGLTPNEFTLKLKLEEALRMLLEEPQYNVSEISYKLGFTSPRYFSRCFKTFFGVSPQNYRKAPAKE